MKALPLLVLAALASATLAGCFGYPPGSARPGDTVTVRYTALDPATGAVVKDTQMVSFAVGSGSSGLGADVERAVVGLLPNATTVVASPASARAYTAVREAPQEFQRNAQVQTYNTTAFTQQVGTPVVGMTFPAFGYNATMLLVTPQEVTFRLDAKDGARQDFPQYGLSVVYRSEGDQLLKVLEPMPGSTFSLFYENQIALQCFLPDGTLGACPVGSYEVLPAQGGHLRFGFFPGTDRTLLAKSLTFQLTLVSVKAGAPPASPAGAYGVRASPQVLGDPSAWIATAPTAATTVG